MIPPIVFRRAHCWDKSNELSASFRLAKRFDLPFALFDNLFCYEQPKASPNLPICLIVWELFKLLEELGQIFLCHAYTRINDRDLQKATYDLLDRIALVSKLFLG